MELMTDEIRKQFKEIGNQEGKGEDAICVVKFFQPWGQWTWYATEMLDEDTFFGLVDGFELEWGSFLLSELQSVKGPAGLSIERDLYGGFPKKLKAVSELAGRL